MILRKEEKSHRPGPDSVVVVVMSESWIGNILCYRYSQLLEPGTSLGEVR